MNNNNTNGYIPISCCSPSSGAIHAIVCVDSEIDVNATDILPYSISHPYTKGCVESFGDFVSSHAVTLGGVGIAIAMIQVIKKILNIKFTY